MDRVPQLGEIIETHWGDAEIVSIDVDHVTAMNNAKRGCEQVIRLIRTPIQKVVFAANRG